ncbi:MAG: type II toxin-antitoxin system HicB family antitoxin [bacterium]
MLPETAYRPIIKSGNLAKSYIFKIVIEEDLKEDGTMAYSAYCPAIEGCVSWGYTFEEARANIQEAIACHIESLLKDGETIPDSIIEIKKSSQRLPIETGVVVNV